MGRDHRGETILPLVYTELRKLAGARMAGLRPEDTLQPTALVHEVYLRLIGDDDPGWNSKAHFFGAAAQAMREILVDYARRKSSLKRGGGHHRIDPVVTLVDEGSRLGLSAEDILSLNTALEKMQAVHPRKAEIVLLRYFGGLTMEQLAEALEVSTRTIEREWRFARAWLKKTIAQ